MHTLEARPICLLPHLPRAPISPAAGRSNLLFHGLVSCIIFLYMVSDHLMTTMVVYHHPDYARSLSHHSPVLHLYRIAGSPGLQCVAVGIGLHSITAGLSRTISVLLVTQTRISSAFVVGPMASPSSLRTQWHSSSRDSGVRGAVKGHFGSLRNRWISAVALASGSPESISERVLGVFNLLTFLFFFSSLFPICHFSVHLLSFSFCILTLAEDFDRNKKRKQSHC